MPSVSGTGGTASITTVSALATRPSLVEWTSRAGKKLSFLIMDAPKPNNLQLYLKECKKHNVVRMVRVCERTYDADEVERAGITMAEMEYDDGDAPPPDVINRWLDVVHSTFNGSSSKQAPAAAAAAAAANGGTNGGGSSPPGGSGGRDSTVGVELSDKAGSGPTVAVHCVAGLGRAPVLVAIALIENGMDPIQAVEYIRSRRRGAINRKQLSYLEQYQRVRRGSCSACCIS
jgi:protein tyrosine phosphatase type IVA